MKLFEICIGLYTYRLSLSLSLSLALSVSRSGVRTVEPGKCKLLSLPGDGLWLVPRHFGKNVPANEKVFLRISSYVVRVWQRDLYIVFRRGAASVCSCLAKYTLVSSLCGYLSTYHYDA
jgi:hypothetical protein